MKIVFSAVWEHMRSERRAYVRETVNYSVFICIVILAVTLVVSFVTSYGAHLDTVYGTYDVCILHADEGDEGVRALSSRGKRGNVAVSGYVRHDGDCFAVGRIDDNAAELLPVAVVSGRMPENDSEVAVEEAALYLLERDGAVDADGRIRLTVTAFDGSVHEREYTVVGEIGRYTDVVPHMNGGDAGQPYDLFPSFFVFSDEGTPAVCHVVIRMGVPSGHLGSELKGYGDNYLTNGERDAQDPRGMFAAFYSVTVLLIIFGIVGLQANVIVNSKRNRALLVKMKCAGVTNAAYLRFRCTAVLTVAVAAFVFGTVSGVLLSLAVSYLIKYLFIDYFAFSFSWISVLTAVLCVAAVCLLNILACIPDCKKRPLEIGREDVSVVTPLRIGKSFFMKHPVLSLAMKTAYANTAKYFGIILSVSAILLFTVAAQTCATAVYRSYNDDIKYDYTLRTSNGAFFSALEIPVTDYCFGDGDISMLSATGELSSCFARSANHVFVVRDKKMPEAPYYVYRDIYASAGKAPERLEKIKAECAQYGYSGDEKLYEITLNGINDETVAALVGDRDIGDSVIVITPADGQQPFYAAGDDIFISAPRLDDSGNVKRVDLKTKIGAVVTAEREMPFYGDSDYVFAVRQSAIDGSFSSGYQYIDMRLRSQNDYSETEDVIRRIAGLHSGDDDLGIVSSRKYNAEKRQAVMLVTVIGGLIVASATVYALLTLTSVLRSSVYERKRIWGYLKAAGMQHKEALMLERVTTAAVIAISFLAALLLGGIFALSMDAELRECVSPFSVLLPPVLILLICRQIVTAIINDFWRQPVRALIHEL